MRNFLKKLGIHQADEMERYILFKAQRNAYLFLTAALLAWSLWESRRVYVFHSRLNPLPCLLLVTAALIQALSRLLLTRRAVKDDEDSYETAPLMKTVMLLCAAAGAAAAVAAAAVLLGAAI